MIRTSKLKPSVRHVIVSASTGAILVMSAQGFTFIGNALSNIIILIILPK